MSGALLVIAVLSAEPAKAAEKSGKKAEEQLKFGVDMARRELWSEALFRFRQAAEMDPRNPGIFNNLAVAYEATGQFEEALEAYKKGLQISPSDRSLKGNYSRFLEFYQAYKVAAGGNSDQDGDEAEATEGEDSTADGGDSAAGGGEEGQ